MCEAGLRKGLDCNDESCGGIERNRIAKARCGGVKRRQSKSQFGDETARNGTATRCKGFEMTGQGCYGIAQTSETKAKP